MLKASQIDAVGDAMREVAAELIVPRFQNLSEGQIDTKSSADDLVTVADREAEAALEPRLMDILPGSVAVGEEAVAKDKSRMDRLKGDDPVWVIDPVDGTANFVAGRPQFAVMVALVVRGQIEAGWIYPPMEDVMAIGIVGSGATLNGEALRALPARPFAEAFGDYAGRYFSDEVKAHYDKAVSKAGGYRAGRCSAYAYLDTARGDLDFVIQYLMSPWDHAAGVAVLREAGGAIRYLDDGSNYSPLQWQPRTMLATCHQDAWADYARRLT